MKARIVSFALLLALLFAFAPHAARANHMHAFGAGSAGDEPHFFCLQFNITNPADVTLQVSDTGSGNTYVCDSNGNIGPQTYSGAGATGTIDVFVAVPGWSAVNYGDDESVDIVFSRVVGSAKTYVDDSQLDFKPSGFADTPSSVIGAVDTIVIAATAISGFTPSSGPVGTSVSITGNGFTGATSVAFGGTSASAFTVASDTQITATVPTGATTGTISVITPGGTATSSGTFTVVAAPKITGYAPGSGPVGNSVTVTGTNFTGATSFTFNGTAATFTVVSSTSIATTVPAGATTGHLGVTTPGGTNTTSGIFTVTPPGGPNVTNFTPGSGSVGTVVTLTGINFTGVTSVTFHGAAASFTVVSSTSIKATVPAGATTGPITVTNPDGSITTPANFTVTASGVPTITSFSPTSGAVGASVTITGTNLTGTSVVGFNGRHPTSFTVNASGTQITTTVPAGATTGTISITTPGGTATSSGTFTVIAVPTITGFSPASGAAGTSVTITGTNLTGTSVVGFNGHHPTSFTVNAAGTQITTTVPTGATTGPVAVIAPGGEAKSATNFTVTP